MQVKYLTKSAKNRQKQGLLQVIKRMLRGIHQKHLKIKLNIRRAFAHEWFKE